ncbi:uncharacterized protein BCR38DRAFT_436210 [Pseudomassariella vexata]|uniref:Uncharacterized protein n=1 Tax=Pseudomassariella vexata TaxID=1141098 RepID=A0A1Y2DVJ0_9PEZI|nr:uncharacterized protein BCR38DRAFT_436210 [Pseudomassariella vexata]ORY63209.1 hypothetical protein BCR38DRAFT_436210 [Pseudomassariella vexata]
MGRTPASGAMPETTVCITEWASENSQQVRIHSLELIPSRLELNKKINDILCGSEHCTFETCDIRNAPKDLRDHDFVYLNAAIGSTMLEKENILIDIIEHEAGSLCSHAQHGFPEDNGISSVSDPNTPHHQAVKAGSDVPPRRRGRKERQHEFHHL